MYVKLKRVISCSSEHSSFPASNLLDHNKKNASWRCATPGEMMAYVSFEMAESSSITGIEIGNYRSCVVIVKASTSANPDDWVQLVNHQFLSNDDAANGKFRDQVEIFTKKELNPETIHLKFDKIQVTCMQTANRKELFGLTFVAFRTQVVVDMSLDGLDVFGKFKRKKEKEEDNVDEFKQKYLKLFGNKQSTFKDDLKATIQKTRMENFSKKQDETREPMKRPLLEKLEAGKSEEVFEQKTEQKTEVKRTPFGDIVETPSPKQSQPRKQDQDKTKNLEKVEEAKQPSPAKKAKKDVDHSNNKVDEKKKPSPVIKTEKKHEDHSNKADSKDKNDGQAGTSNGDLPSSSSDKKAKLGAAKNKPKKATKEFSKLFEGIKFSLSGYVNPQRDEIRKKALKMGAKYIADPDTTNCTHLICAFKNTPKYQQLKSSSKIVSHKFIEICFEKKKRFPWRRFALDTREKNKDESEEEIEASVDPYEAETDEESDPYY